MLNCQKDKFHLPDDVSYLNSASMSPQLRSVEAAGVQGLMRKNRPYEIGSDDFFEPVNTLRKQFAKLIHSKEPQRIAMIPSVSYGIGIVAKNLRLNAGDEILLVQEQFPSNMHAWRRKAKAANAVIKIVAMPLGGASLGKAWNEAILAAINERTAIVAIPQLHWSHGIAFDLKSIREKTRMHDALLVIDGTQSIGAYPFSIEDIQPDALICATYKWLLGPYSSGYAYLGEAFDDGIPLEETWMNRVGSDDFARLSDYEERYREGAQRYNVGEFSNFISIPMLQAALTQLEAWSPAQIQAYCQEVTAPTIERLRATGFHIAETEERGTHLFGIRPTKDIDLKGVKKKLDEEKIYLSIRGEYIRVSAYLFNEKNDFERLFDLLKTVV